MADVWIDQFAAQQSKRRLVIKFDVVKRIGENLARPHQAGLHVLYEKQLYGAEDKTPRADHEPDQCNVVDEIGGTRRRLKDAEVRRIEEQWQRRQCPDRQQYDFSLQIIADLYLFLMFVAGRIDS